MGHVSGGPGPVDRRLRHGRPSVRCMCGGLHVFRCGWRRRVRCGQRAVRRGLTFEAVIAGATMVTSALYHLCESIERPVLGMNAGNWHRLDNIFAIVTPVAVVPLLMGRARTPQHQRDIDFVRWSSLFIGLFFQELNPWNVLCTITPVILAFLYYLWWWNTVHKSNCRDASNHGLYAIDATSARRRPPGGLSPLDAVSTCTRSTG